MRTFGIIKPPLEDLEHHGVKGMHWGVRNPRSTSAEIHAARARQRMRNDQAFTAPTAKKRAAAAKDFKTNEDRVTAARMTIGEKAALTMLRGPSGLIILGVHSSHERSVARNVDIQRTK